MTLPNLLRVSLALIATGAAIVAAALTVLWALGWRTEPA